MPDLKYPNTIWCLAQLRDSPVIHPDFKVGIRHAMEMLGNLHGLSLAYDPEPPTRLDRKLWNDRLHRLLEEVLE